MSEIPRLTDLPLPPYTFVPGKTPHPHSDPAGHRFHPPPFSVPDSTNWRECPAYVHGIDLFNHGYYWEAHEAWEGCWNAAGRRGAIADFLKAMIQLCVAGVKDLEGVPEGVSKHARRAGELFRDLAGQREVFLGVRLAELIALSEIVREKGWPGTPPRLRP
jgi:hypothetical protein